jgi:hypothetical protein
VRDNLANHGDFGLRLPTEIPQSGTQAGIGDFGFIPVSFVICQWSLVIGNWLVVIGSLFPCSFLFVLCRLSAEIDGGINCSA